jgi:hypothetical protein
LRRAFPPKLLAGDKTVASLVSPSVVSTRLSAIECSRAYGLGVCWYSRKQFESGGELRDGGDAWQFANSAQGSGKFESKAKSRQSTARSVRYAAA